MGNAVFQEIEKRNVPSVFALQNGETVKSVEDWNVRKQEIKKLYLSEVYGDTGLDKGSVKWDVVRRMDKFIADKATYQYIQVTYQSEQGEYQFPFHLTMPKGVEKAPVFLYLSFDASPFNACMPLEEIIDQGYGVVSMNYQDLALDVPEYRAEKLSALVPEEKRSGCGTIALWAFGASKIMDCLKDMPQVDFEKVAVVGHSRLGKAAIWAGAVDERYSMVIGNDAGAGGPAFFRGTSKETLKDLCRPQINFWFNDQFLTYADRAEEIPLDQHFLLSLIAPRHLYISSAADDEWADYQSEFLAAVEASKVYELLGEKGLLGEDGTTENITYPEVGTIRHQGKIGMHVRPGNHFFSRYDWNQIIAYRKLHNC